MKIENKIELENKSQEEKIKKLSLEPMIETKIEKTYLINPKFYSDFVYEFRKTRKEIERAAERIVRLAKIGMLINKMKHTQNKKNKI
ncbi:MAG: hypothetical protein QXV64_02275 [Candidatus Anstonellaceae archaeon]